MYDPLIHTVIFFFFFIFLFFLFFFYILFNIPPHQLNEGISTPETQLY